MSFKPAHCFIACMSITTSIVFADTGQDDGSRPGARDVEEVVVNAARLGKDAGAMPIKVEIFDEAQVRRQQTLATNPTEMLANLIPSYAPSRQKLTNSGESFRGRTPLFLVDGVPQSTPLRPGAREGFTIDMEMVERIEVLFGPNAMQGLGGTGGVINYITLSPPESGDLEQRASFSVTNNDDFDEDGFGWRSHYMIARDFGRFDVTASASYERHGLQFDADDRPIGVDFNAGDIANSDSRDFFGKFGWDIDADQRLQFTVNDFYLEQDMDFVAVDGDRSRGIPTSSVEGEHPGRAPYNDVTTTSLDYNHGAFLSGTLSVQAYYQDFASLFGGRIIGSFQDPAIAPVGTLFEQSENNSEKYGTRLTYKYPGVAGLPLDVVTGFDVLRDKTAQPLVLTGRTSVPPTTFYNYAPFLQLDYQVLGWLSLSGGARWEIADLEVPDYTTRAGNRADFQPVDVEGGERSFDDVLYNIGAVVNPTDELSFYASYSEAFSMPDVGRVLRSVSEFGTEVDTLLDINPLITENREIGATYQTGAFELRVTYFESDSDFGSRLVARPDGTFDLARQATETSGWEFSGGVNPTDWLSFRAGYSLLDGEFDSDGDNSPDSDLGARDIGPDRLSFYLDITPPGRFSAHLQSFTYFDKDFKNAAGEETAEFDGYTTFDAVVKTELDVATLSLSISNLLDKQYISYYGQAATSADSQFYAGRGRTITLRAETSF